MADKVYPLIKEPRVARLADSLECIFEHPLDRSRQSRCILRLYANPKSRTMEHREKSILRGMVFPSLRYLGLVMGRDDYVRCSSNGALLVEAMEMRDELFRKVFRILLAELDSCSYDFITYMLRRGRVLRSDALLDAASRIPEGAESGRMERVGNWLLLLEQTGLMHTDEEHISLDMDRYREACQAWMEPPDDSRAFGVAMMKAYECIGPSHGGVVDIMDLRRETSLVMLRETGRVLTERRFDEALRSFPLDSANYAISFGESMGTRDGLFEREGKVYRTIYIEFHSGGMS